MTPEKIKTMPAAKVAELITECNKWRNGEPPYNYGWNKPPLTPREFDAILDRAVELLNEQKTKLEQIKLDIYASNR